jgi:hypothetical protein
MEIQIFNCVDFGDFGDLKKKKIWEFFSPQRNREFVTEYSFSKRFLAKRWKKKKLATKRKFGGKSC